MGASSVDQIVYAIGKLYKNPTSLATPSGYGTELGLVKDVVLRPTRAYSKLTAEEFGVEAVDYLDLGEADVLAAVLRAPLDGDALATLFPGAVVGASSGGYAWQWPPHASPITAAEWRAGRLLSARSVVLLFVSLDAARHPSAILYRALPMLEDTAELNHSLANPLELGVVFAGVRDSSDRVVASGRLEDLSAPETVLPL